MQPHSYVLYATIAYFCAFRYGVYHGIGLPRFGGVLQLPEILVSMKYRGSREPSSDNGEIVLHLLSALTATIAIVHPL